MSTPPATQTSAAPDLSAVKTRQRATWTSGNYSKVGTTLQIMGETLCESVDLRSGERVLDVAAGNGNASLAAARRFAEVVSTDYVAALLEAGAARARAEDLPISFQEADAEALPFPDGSFDVVLSTVGSMFAPDHPKTASEMLRVCRSGGRIGLASWTPEGFIGRLFVVVGRHVPPPAGVSSPLLWGTEAHVRALFHDGAEEVRAEKRSFVFRYRSATHFVDWFRTYYGPVHRAFASLDDAGRAAFERDILALLATSNTSGDTTIRIPSEYLEVVISRR
jgi:SAM-dependent methyltransferase